MSAPVSSLRPLGRRPGTLRIGDRVRFDGVLHTVVGLAGTQVRLADERGVGMVVQLAYLLAHETFEIVGGADHRAVASSRLPEGLPADAVEEARWWERHILEVLSGLPPDAPESAVPRPEYDPAVWSLTRREAAKAAELTKLGHPVKASTLKHRRQRYEARGLAGLVDGRAGKRMARFGRVDERVVAAMRAVIGEATDASSRTAGYIFWRTGQILAEAHGEGTVAMPSRATCYRLLDKLAAGRHTTGSARTRRSLANRPDGPFSQVQVAAPGELMQIDSTPLDVLVLLDDGVPARVELTGMIDVATRTVTAAVLRPTTKSVDASVLLARTVTPE
ncbi:MAG: integrase, partial [Pseudonocardiaceae bacterium]